MGTTEIDSAEGRGTGGDAHSEHVLNTLITTQPATTTVRGRRNHGVGASVTTVWGFECKGPRHMLIHGIHGWG